jgi:hypothetical protein
MKPRRPTPNLSQLSDRDLAVIDDVSSFRAMTGHQIRRLHFDHPNFDGSAAGALRNSQRTLNRLVRVGLLATLPRRVGGVRAGSAGLTYVLGYHGQRLVRPDRRARTPEGLGDRYVAHTLAVAEIAVGLRERTNRHTAVDQVVVEVEPECWREFPASRRTVTLKPDLFLTVAAGEVEHRWFVEVDLATESLVRIRSKCQTYLDYYFTGIETDLHGVFPKVVWVAPDRRRADQIIGVITKMPAPATAMFTVTTATIATDTLTKASNTESGTKNTTDTPGDGTVIAGEVTTTAVRTEGDRR